MQETLDWKMQIKVLNPTGRFTDLAEMILDGVVSVQEHKIIFLIIGRAKMAVVEDLDVKGMKTCIDTIHSFNRFTMVVLEGYPSCYARFQRHKEFHQHESKVGWVDP